MVLESYILYKVIEMKISNTKERWILEFNYRFYKNKLQRVVSAYAHMAIIELSYVNPKNI